MRRRHTLLILFTILLTLPFACGQGKDDKMLEQFKQIQATGDTLPKEALARLDSLKDKVAEKSTYMQMKYNLLRARLQDKAYITPTSDYIIKEVHGYFEKHGTDAEKMEARYYLASTYRDLRDMPRALTFFLKAYEIAENGGQIDSVMWKNTCSQLSGIYLNLGETALSIKYAQKGYEIKKAIGTLDPTTIMDLATPYYCMGDTLTALKYYEMALVNILQSDSMNRISSILAESMLAYTYCKDRKTAGKYYQLLQNIPEEEKAYNQDIACAEYSRRFISLDSAITYAYNAWKNGGSWAHKYTGSGQLMKCYIEKGMFKEACDWALLHEIAHDSLMELKNQELTLKAHNEYHYYRNMESEQRAYMEAKQSQIRLYAGISISTLVLMAMATTFFYYKKRMAEKLLRKEREIKAAHSSVKAKEEELQESQRLVQQREQELEESQHSVHQKEEELNSKKEQNELLMKLRLQAAVSEDAPEIMEKLMRTADRKCTLTEKEWNRLMCVIDMQHPELLEKFTQIFPSQKAFQMRTAYLVAAGMTNAQIAKLTDKSASTVWRTAKKVRDLLGMQDKSDAPMPQE